MVTFTAQSKIMQGNKTFFVLSNINSWCVLSEKDILNGIKQKTLSIPNLRVQNNKLKLVDQNSILEEELFLIYLSTLVKDVNSSAILLFLVIDKLRELINRTQNKFYQFGTIDQQAKVFINDLLLILKRYFNYMRDTDFSVFCVKGRKLLTYLNDDIAYNLYAVNSAKISPTMRSYLNWCNKFLDEWSQKSRQNPLQYDFWVYFLSALVQKPVTPERNEVFLTVLDMLVNFLQSVKHTIAGTLMYSDFVLEVSKACKQTVNGKIIATAQTCALQMEELNAATRKEHLNKVICKTNKELYDYEQLVIKNAKEWNALTQAYGPTLNELLLSGTYKKEKGNAQDITYQTELHSSVLAVQSTLKEIEGILKKQSPDTLQGLKLLIRSLSLATSSSLPGVSKTATAAVIAFDAKAFFKERWRRCHKHLSSETCELIKTYKDKNYGDLQVMLFSLNEYWYDIITKKRKGNFIPESLDEALLPLLSMFTKNKSLQQNFINASLFKVSHLAGCYTAFLKTKPVYLQTLQTKATVFWVLIADTFKSLAPMDYARSADFLLFYYTSPPFNWYVDTNIEVDRNNLLIDIC